VRTDEDCYVHASAAAPERWEYVDGRAAALRSMLAAGTARTYSGHVHHQELFIIGAGERVASLSPRPGVAVPLGAGRRALVLAGSVGQPRDGNTAAAYALFDAGQSSVVFHRVPYDNLAAASRVREAGLPASLAYRLERGI
jgi:diadenosine tetraphosphatase ApaH/serine/threonine PP2A family protein phosphatase